jgi:hypothetical protein
MMLAVEPTPLNNTIRAFDTDSLTYGSLMNFENSRLNTSSASVVVNPTKCIFPINGKNAVLSCLTVISPFPYSPEFPPAEGVKNILSPLLVSTENPILSPTAILYSLLVAGVSVSKAYSVPLGILKMRDF